VIRSNNYPYGGYLDLDEKFLLYIEENDRCTVSEVRDALGISQPLISKLVSKHVSEKNVGYVWIGVRKLLFINGD